MPRIRAARREDGEWARALVRRAYALYVPRMGQEPAPMLADYAALIDAGELQVLEEAGSPVALIVLRPEEDAIFVENIAVDPQVQRKGHGRALLAFAEDEARRLGLTAIRLYTNAAMTENLAYYPRLGFRETDRREEDGYKRVFFEKRWGDPGRRMTQRIFWIEWAGSGRLAILSRPAPEQLSDEIAAWRVGGVTMVASLLEPKEQRALGLRDEAALCRAHRIEFASFPIADGGVPASLADGVALARRLGRAIEAGGTVGVHCRASIGRSGMMAASVLIALGRSEDQALEAVAAGRGLRVPETPEQRAWVSAAARELVRPL